MKKFPNDPPTITDGIDREFSPWIKEVQSIDHGSFYDSGVTILAVSPAEDSTDGALLIGRFLRSNRIGAAFMAAYEQDMLDKPELMLRGKYSDGTKEDVDTVLQMATYREVIWGE